MLFQQFLYHHTHLRSGGVAFLPVDGAIPAQGICQFFCDSNKFLVLVEVLDRLRLCQCIVEGKLICRKSKLFALFICGSYLFCQVGEVPG